MLKIIRIGEVLEIFDDKTTHFESILKIYCGDDSTVYIDMYNKDYNYNFDKFARNKIKSIVNKELIKERQ